MNLITTQINPNTPTNRSFIKIKIIRMANKNLVIVDTVLFNLYKANHEQG